jgi:hypothetical protein|tara:strand:- start:6639 stop:7040 length:402 start_codon:yes stop_codon:yes gene_type:complete
MKLHIKNIREIESFLKRNQEGLGIETKEYEEKCLISSRDWFIKEFSLPLGKEISDLIDRAHNMGIGFHTDSIVRSFEESQESTEAYEKFIDNIYYIMTYESNVNHSKKTIDYKNKRLVYKYFFCNDKCCKVVK